VEVDLLALDDVVDSRAGQVVVGDQRQHALLELAAGGLRAGGEAVKRRGERLCAAARELGEPRTQNGGIQEAVDLGAVAGALEPVRGQDVGRGRSARGWASSSGGRGEG
jgi:hypothetical protein